jgi:hypothetical protein
MRSCCLEANQISLLCSTSLCRTNLRPSLSRGECHFSPGQNYQIRVVDVYDLVLHGHRTPSGSQLVLLHQHFGIGSFEHGALQGSGGRCMARRNCRCVARSSRNIVVEPPGLLRARRITLVGSLQAVPYTEGRWRRRHSEPPRYA